MKAPPERDAAADVAVDRKTLLNDTLRRRITSMELAPGAVVDEVGLAEEFGLSRPPVRELMRQLAAEGYLELAPNRPARVAAMSYESMRSFFLAAPLIYVATTQLAAQHATADEIAELREVQAQFRTAIAQDDVAARVHFNDQFHHAIGKMAHNDYLMPSLRRLLIDHARMGKVFYRQPSSDEMRANLAAAVEQHEQIIAAIASHDAQLAGELVRAHWELSRARMTDYVVPSGMALPLNADGSRSQPLSDPRSRPCAGFFLACHRPQGHTAVASPPADLIFVTTQNCLTPDPGMQPDIFINKIARVREAYVSVSCSMTASIPCAHRIT